MTAAMLKNATDSEEVIESPLVPLGRDLLAGARLMTPVQARYLVDYYYQVQNYRVRANNQVKAAGEQGEPNAFVTWSLDNMRRTEAAVRSALAEWADERLVGRWAQSVYGIGPVIAAGLDAHIDINKAPTVGHIWRFAGVAGWDQVWLGKQKSADLVKEVCGPRGFDRNDIPELARRAGRQPDYLVRALEGIADKDARKAVTDALAKRPWNADLKVLVFKIGQSFVYRSNSPKDHYGRFYKEYKARQTALNEQHHFADQAAHALATTNFRAETDARAWLEKGMLPPAQIHARALRYCAKMFLAGWHEVAYFVEHGQTARRPYAIEYLGHMEYIPPPNLDVVPGLRVALERREGKSLP